MSTASPLSIRFAAIYASAPDSTGKSVDYVNNNSSSDEFPETTGDNAKENVSTTEDMAGQTVDFVSSQQLSTAGTTDNQVKFVAKPYIKLPALDETKAKEFNTGDKNVSAGPTTTEGWYESAAIELKDEDGNWVNPSSLAYATLNFSKIQMSKYSKMHIQYSVNGGKYNDFVDGLVDEYDLADRSVQIPLDQIKGTEVKICAVIQTPGQVNTAKNAGFTIKNITGVYKSQVDSTTEELKDASITWAINSDNVTYEVEQPLSSGIVYDYLNEVELKKDGKTAADQGYTFTYEVPTFPYTGNAFIKVKDKNSSVVAYYACPVENNGRNKNILRQAVYFSNPWGDDLWIDADDYSEYNTWAKAYFTASTAYRITKYEAENKVGTIVKQDESGVVVNSEKEGVTHLVGTISSDVLDLDAENDKIYTSVQWNPVLGKDDSDGLLALIGQTVTVTAQLVDVNGEAASIKDEAITWTYEANDKVTEVAKAGFTDAEGKATLKLNSANVTVLEGVTATSKKYNVVLTVNGNNVKKADVYWINGYLTFHPNAYGSYGWSYTVSNSPDGSGWANEHDKTSYNVAPSVGQTWDYQIVNFEQTLKGGCLDGTKVTPNFAIKMTATNAAKDEVTNNGDNNGKATVTTKSDKIITLTGTIDATSAGNDFTFKLGDRTVQSAGTGTHEVRSTFKILADFGQVGEQGFFVGVDGNAITSDSYKQYADVNAHNYVYFKVTDGEGNAIKTPADHKVTFKATDATLVGAEADGTVTVTPGSDGIAVADIASFTGTADANNVKIAQITATTNDSAKISQVLTARQNKVTTENVFALSGAKLTNTGAITLTFTDSILADSVTSGMFALTAYKTEGGAAQTYKLDGSTCKVDGKTITLQLDSNNLGANWTNKAKFSLTITNPQASGSIQKMITSQTTGQVLDGVITITQMLADGSNAANAGVIADTSESNSDDTLVTALIDAKKEAFDTAYDADNYTFNATALTTAKAKIAGATVSAVAAGETAAKADAAQLLTDAQIVQAVISAVNTAEAATPLYDTNDATTADAAKAAIGTAAIDLDGTVGSAVLQATNITATATGEVPATIAAGTVYIDGKSSADGKTYTLNVYVGKSKTDGEYETSSTTSIVTLVAAQAAAYEEVAADYPKTDYVANTTAYEAAWTGTAVDAETTVADVKAAVTTAKAALAKLYKDEELITAATTALASVDYDTGDSTTKGAIETALAIDLDRDSAAQATVVLKTSVTGNAAAGEVWYTYSTETEDTAPATVKVYIGSKVSAEITISAAS